MSPDARPTVVLVHGAFTDSSCWGGVITELIRVGYPVRAVANPLRGVSTDADYVRSTLAAIPTRVILVGHSYGGMVTTNAARWAPNVTALVYLAGLVPDTGETASDLVIGYPSDLEPNTMQVTPELDADGKQTGVYDVTIRPEYYHRAFCADVPDGQAAIMAATQRPLSAAAIGEASGVPAWRSLPSWYQVCARDRVIPPAAQRVMAQRIGAKVMELDSSHASMVSRPTEIAEFIQSAAE